MKRYLFIGYSASLISNNNIYFGNSLFHPEDNVMPTMEELISMVKEQDKNIDRVIILSISEITEEDYKILSK